MVDELPNAAAHSVAKLEVLLLTLNWNRELIIPQLPLKLFSDAHQTCVNYHLDGMLNIVPVLCYDSTLNKEEVHHLIAM